MKGIIRSIPVTAVSEGTYVMTENGDVFKVEMKDVKRFALRSIDDNNLKYDRFSLEEWQNKLNRLVIEYRECCSEQGNQMCGGSVGICKMTLKINPLKYSVWKEAYQNNLINKEVEIDMNNVVNENIDFAIVKNYTKKDLEEFGLWLLKNYHSVWSIQQLVNQWEYDKNQS